MEVWHNYGANRAIVSLTIANIIDANAGSYTVVVSNPYGSVTSAPPATLTVTHPPVITDQTGSQVFNAGDEAVFSVTVSGSTPFFYQWATNGTSLAGETTNTIDLLPVLDSDAAAYSVVVTNVDGSVTSTPALLTVVDPELVGTPSIASALNTCTNVTLSVAVHGADPSLTYQWYHGTTPVGTGLPTLTLSDLSFADAGAYSVKVQNSAGSYAYADGTLTIVDPAPVITGCPSDILTNTGPGRTTCDQVVSWVPPTASDNCSVANFVSNYHPGDLFSVGTTLVTYTATDSSNQVTTCSFNVTVQDNTPPVVGTKSWAITLDTNGNASISLSDVYDPNSSSDNCGTVTPVSVSQTQFTFCDLPSKSVTVTAVDSHGNVGSASAMVTINAPVAPPAVVYVDASYGTSCANVTFPNAGGTGSYYVGYNAFSTIQAAVNAVASGGTVNVASGAYVEDVTITKPLALVGPNATNNPNTGTRVAEAIIYPATQGPNPFTDDEVVVYVETNNVSISGFTVDGANPAMTGGILVGTNNVDASEGIASWEGVGSITIANNIVKNTTYSGLDFDDFNNSGTPTTGNEFTGNLFSNMGTTNFGYGFAVLIYDNFYADISSNVMSNVRIGVQTGNYWQANPGSAQYQNISDNIITCGREGIFHNLAYDAASPYTLSNNIITAWQMPGGQTYNREWVGILLSSIQSSVTATAVNNTIVASPTVVTTSGNNIGYNIWNVPSIAGVTVTGGSVSNVSYGVWVNNWDGYNSQGDSTKATISGVNISSATLAGVYVQDDPRSTNGSVQATVHGNTVVTGSGVGVMVQGTNAAATVEDNNASITGNTIGVSVNTGKALLQNNDLRSNTVAGINVTNGAVVDAGNCTEVDVTGLGTSTGGNNLSGYGFDNAAPWAIINGNTGTLAVLAEHDIFGAVAGDAIASAFSGTVEYSQSPAVITAPPDTNVVCISAIPQAAIDLGGFTNQGGYYSGNVATVTNSDDTNFPGSGVIHRTYTLSDGCVTNKVVQTITVSDTVPPYFVQVPSDAIYSADPGQCSKSNVTWVVTAGDNCSVTNLVSVPPSGSTFNKGTNVVVITATDSSGNTSVTNFTVTVKDTENPVVTVWPASTNLDVNGQCQAPVPDLTTQIFATDNCDTPVYTQSPAAGTLVSLGVTNVLVTVSDLSGNAVSSNITLTVVDSNPAPFATYVDTNYATLAAGTVVKFPYGGTGADHYVGCDAFGTIQSGINRVAPTGTVNVAAGVYAEDVSLNKSATLIGPNGAIDPNTGTRVAEAVIVPATARTSSQGTTSGVIIRVGSSLGHVDATIKGFTLDGHNAGISSGLVLNGVEIDTGAGIANSIDSFDRNPGAFDTTLVVQNNILQNLERYGVLVDNVPVRTPNSGNDVSHNKIDNLPAGNNFSTPGGGRGRGVAFEENTYGTCASNVITRVNVGWQDDNYNLPSPGAATLVIGNTISTYYRGIFHNLQYQSATPATISGNNVQVETRGDHSASDSNFGIELASIQGAVNSTVTDNNVTNNIYGILLWNVPTTVPILVSGGTLSGNQYGVWATSHDPQFGPAAASQSIISNVTVLNATNAGVAVDDSLNIAATTLTVTGNSLISNCVTGVLVEGVNAGASVLNDSASITGNAIGVSVDTGKALLQNNDLTGNTVAGINVTNGAVVDAGNCTGVNVTGLGTSTGGNNLSGYGFDNAAPWAVINGNTSSTPAMLAEHDIFGATAGVNISAAFSNPSGSIIYSQNSLIATPPSDTNVECVLQAPAAAVDLPGFLGQGGTVTASSVTVVASDVPPIAPETTTVRTYTISDGCSSTTVQQTIRIHDVTPPIIGNCPASFVSPGPVISYTLPTATDNCGPGTVVVTGNPPSGSTLGAGVHTVVCTATDNAGLTNSCSFQIVVPSTSLTDAYVDASYGSLPPGTSVAWPNSGGSGSHSIGLDAFSTVQAGVNAVETGGTVHVAPGTYSESVAANKPVSLLGANTGVNGCGARSLESIINAGAGIALDVQSDGVTVDGFSLQGGMGVRDISHKGLVAQNNLVSVSTVGIELQNISPTAGAGVTIQSNCVSLSTQISGSSLTIGVALFGVSGTNSPVIQGNSISGAYYGYQLYAVDASQPTIIKGGSISGVMQGVAVININPITRSDYLPSLFTVDGVTMSGFAGNYPVPSLSGVNFHAGVYVYTGGSSATNTITGLVTNVTVSGTGKISPDSAGLYFTDFSTATGTMQQITVQGTTVQNNLNRGVFVSGAGESVNVTQSTITGNGGDPYATGGNHGFGIIARNNAQVSVTQSFVANPATQTNDNVYALSADANTNPLGPTLTINNCSIVNNGNGYLAEQSAGTLNASGNWWGGTNANAIAALTTGAVDFTPYLDSGADTDGATPGFQGDFSVLHVTALGSQTGAGGRIQEGIDDVVGGKVFIEAGSYVENILANKTDLELAGVGQSAVTIVPALSAPNTGGGSLPPGASSIILIQADGVTIHDMTLNGDNPALTSGITVGGADLDARNGIIEDYYAGTGTWNGTVVHDVTVKNIYLRGIYASSGGTGFNFYNNTVQNVQADPSSVAMFNYGGSGTMASNHVSEAGDAISANWSSGTVFLDNTITDSGSGVHTDNSSGPDLLAGNTVSAMQSGAYGVFVFAPHGNIVVSNNIISGCSVGLASAGQGASTTPVFVGNQVSEGTGAGSMGVYETTSLFGYGFAPVSTVFQGNTITGSTYGFYLEDENGDQLSASITAGNTVTGNQYGVYATGPAAYVKLENTDLRSNTSAAITADSGAVVDAGNCGGADVTGLGASTGGNNLTGYIPGPAKAVVNANVGGTPPVLAYNDSFGATALAPDITSALSGTVIASQSGGILALPPAAFSVQCPESVTNGANSLATFSGVVSATAATVLYIDGTLNPGPYDGTIIRTYTISDACGQTTQVHQTIAVSDTTPPVITYYVTNKTIYADPTAHAPVPDLTIGAIATDNCVAPVTITQSPLAGTSIGLGNTTVTLTAIDASGNHSTSVNATVTVKDVTPPAVTCPGDVTVTTLQAKDPYATGTATATDAGGTVSITYNDDRSGLSLCDSTGTILRTWTGTDPSGNSSTCVQTITVVDTTTPNFTLVPANVTVTNDLYVCGAVVNYSAPTAEDLGYSQDFSDPNWVSGSYVNNPSTDWNDYNSHVSRVASGTDGIVSLDGIAHAVIDSTASPAAGDNTGAYSRLGGYSSVFGAGYRVAQDVYVDLNDPQVRNATSTSGYAWDLSAAANGQNGSYFRDFIFHAAAYDPTGVVIAASNNSSDSADNRGGDLRTGNHAVITSSGWYTFQWLFRNTNNVLAVDLSVMDTNGVVLFTQTLSNPGDLISSMVGGHRYLWFTFVNTDKLPIGKTILEREVPVAVSLASGSSFAVGTNTVVLNATNACGNTSSTNFTITVIDAEPPFIPALTDVTQTNDPGLCSAVVSFTLPTNSITDNCFVAGIVATPSSGSVFPVGTNPVVVVVTDIHGNSATNGFNVVVNDTEPPSAHVPADIVQANDTGNCGAVVSFTLPAQTDNCGVAGQVATPASGSTFPVGTTLVTVVVTDIHGNTATNTFHVTVNDTEAPIVTCPANIVQAVDAGQHYATVSFSPTATDNCGVSNVVATPASGSHFPAGTNVVSVVATDIHGNTSLCSFTVLAVDLPLITQQPASRTNNAGTTATFSVAASSPTPLSYQWKKGAVTLTDGGNISGSSTATLSIANVSDTDVAGYSVSVSNLAGSVSSGTAYLTVIDPPVFASQPASLTNNATTTASFAVSVTGTAPFAYQWYKNGTNLLADGGNVSGSQSNILTLSNVLAADRGLYSVVVTNPAATITSSNATLAVIDPWILTQPASSTNPLSGTVSFSVTAIGTSPLTYLWSQNGLVIPTATNSTYTIGTIRDSDSGSYTVLVSSAGGSVTSAPATLTVTHPPVFVTQPSSVTVNVGQNASFNVTMNGTFPFSYQWQKNGVNIGGATAHLFTLSNVSTSDAGTYDVVVTNPDGQATSRNVTLTVIVTPFIVTQPAGETNNAGTTASFSVVAGGTSISYQWFKNGTNRLTDGGNVSGSTNATLTLTNVLGADGGIYSVLITNVGGTLASSNALLAVIDPIITSEPVSVTAVLGSPASFTVGAYGTSPAYQWRKNGSPITGANGSTLAFAGVADPDGASYDCVVSNAYGSVTSAPPAVLTVWDPPVIVTGPASRTNVAGTTATFTVAATGTPPLGYQWLKNSLPLSNGGNISGATSATLTVSGVSDSDIGGYSVTVTNVAGAPQTSGIASLTVLDPPQIVSQPLSRTNVAGTTATFTVGANGTSPLSYQWLKGSTPLVNGGNISGATSATLSISAVSDSDVASYSVVVTNVAGSPQTSIPATLTVLDPPQIVSQPLSRTNVAGTTATFTVNATGTAPLGYQWLKDSTPLVNAGNISGATSPTLTISTVSDSDAASYSVVVTNIAGSPQTTIPATLTVLDPPVIVTQPVSQTNAAGSTAVFSVTATGTPALGYQWFKNGTNSLVDTGNISGSTSNILTLTNVLGADAGYYTVVITNSAGSATSTNATLTVADPVIAQQPAAIKAIDGSTVRFTVVAVGTAPLSYHWRVDGYDLQDGFGIGGSGTATLSITNVTDSDAGDYSVVVSNAEGNVTSVDAALTTVPALIVTPPANTFVLIGHSYSFSVGVNGTQPFSYQWLKDSVSIAGATNRIYSANLAAVADDGLYQVVVTNPDGTQTSNPARLVVYTNPVPVLEMESYANGQFAVIVTGVPGFNYSIQATTNLTDWTPLMTNVAPFTYIDTNGYPQRFYRGLW
jgi:hypothetical protein